MPEAAFHEDARYAYALGQLRARERRLLPRAAVIRWIDEGLDAVLRGLEEAGYDCAERPTRWTDVDFDGMLEERRHREDRALEGLARDPALAEFLDLPRRLRRMRVVLRFRTAGLDPDEAPLDEGRRDEACLRDFMKGEGGIGASEPLCEGLRLGLAVWEETASLARVDDALEAWGLARRQALAEELGNAFCLERVRMDVDRANLARLLRLHGGTTREGRSAFLPGGFLDRDRLAEALDLDGATLAGAFAATRWAAALAEGLPSWIRGEGTAVLERALDDAAMEHLRGCRLASFGPELLVAWHGAVATEGLNLRNLFVGRVNELPRDEVAGRMRETYV